MHLNRIIKLLALSLAAALCLSACSGTQSSPENTRVSLPEPAVSETRQVLGDNSVSGEYEATLHFASVDSISLNTATRTIQLAQDEALVEKILQTLLMDDAALSPVEASLIGCETGSGIVTVNLSLEAAVNRSDQDYLLLCASIANTLLEIEGIEAVNILTGNRSETLCGLPMGLFTQAIENISAAYAQIHSESERFPSENHSGISRSAALYFPAQDGKYLLGEIRELQFSDETDYASAIVNALMEGPLLRTSCFSALPDNPDLLAQKPIVHLTKTGERVIELKFSSALANHLSMTGIEPWQLYASLVLSLCSFVPEADAVRISMDELYVSQCSINGIDISFEDALMRRSDFSPAIGASAQLCFANDENSLTSIEYPLSQGGAQSAGSLISALITADISQRSDIHSVFPEGIIPQDILGVSVDKRIATVNLSARFYAHCQNLSASQERLLVYAMVNTLSSLEQIGAVTFLVEGNQTDSLAGNIYLKTALMPDWGLIKNTIPSTDEIQP